MQESTARLTPQAPVRWVAAPRREHSGLDDPDRVGQHRRDGACGSAMPSSSHGHIGSNALASAAAKRCCPLVVRYVGSSPCICFLIMLYLHRQ